MNTISRKDRKPGGGRKPIPPEKKRVMLSCRVKPETFDTICRKAGQESIGRLLDKVFNSEIPKDLEEAAEKLYPDRRQYVSAFGTIEYISLWSKSEKDAFIAGAKWQEEQFEKNRLAACDNMSKEEYDMETNFVDSIIKKEHRQPTFSDAINYGMRLQKKQMENDSIDCLVCAGMEGDKWIMTYIGNYESMLKTCKAGDKVRIIVCKNED